MNLTTYRLLKVELRQWTDIKMNIVIILITSSACGKLVSKGTSPPSVNYAGLSLSLLLLNQTHFLLPNQEHWQLYFHSILHMSAENILTNNKLFIFTKDSISHTLKRKNPFAYNPRGKPLGNQCPSNCRQRNLN